MTVTKPILFSGPMVRALLDGRKTQTRRVLKPRPPFDRHDDIDVQVAVGDVPIPHAAGGLLWVREDWKADFQLDGIKAGELGPHEPVLYLADNKLHEPTCIMVMAGRRRWSCHMPRWASRLTLRVTDVRVQRVQDIGTEDARAEGVELDAETGGWWGAEGLGVGGATRRYYSARMAFRDLWNSLNAGRGFGWDVNPWVCATTFDVISKNIDEVSP